LPQDLDVIRVLISYAVLAVRVVPALFRSRSEQAIVELTLRQQLATYASKPSRPRLTPLDRTFWIILSRCWPRWKACLVIVQPETVVRWHRRGFRLYWQSISKRGPGRPPISPELRALIRRLATENGWGARKIQAELEMLGFRVSLATVSRYLPNRRPDLARRQGWTTFLRNHRDVIAAMDFLVVPTARFKLFYVWFAIEHGRRRVLHANVTAHPDASWTLQQLREAFPDEHALRYLIHDNDAIFSERVIGAIGHLGSESKRTAYRSPWQNGIAERWVGTVRRELLDHVVVIDENHLRRILREYVDYYNRERVHTRLRDSPAGRPIEKRPSASARIVGLPRVGGLHHRYAWREAA
jgi:transposase InsO family protein